MRSGQNQSTISSHRPSSRYLHPQLPTLTVDVWPVVGIVPVERHRVEGRSTDAWLACLPLR